VTRRSRTALAALAAAIALQRNAAAHVGSPDVFLDGMAGPYRLLVTVRPPYAIPGVAAVDILTTGDEVRGVHIVPLPLSGPGAQFAPVADRAARSSDDLHSFTGHLWLMTAGAWQVRVTVDGDRGTGTLSIPIPTFPQSTLAMNRGIRVGLFGLMFLLAAGFIGIASAMAREARLEPGAAVDHRARRRGWIVGLVAACLVGGVVFLGNWWWTVEASRYARYVYKPLQATPTVTPDSRLRLALHDPGWIASRQVNDFVPDHGHLMHLFVVSPALDRLWHLHPDETTTGTFEQRLPDLPPGQYELFADLVHATGVSETVTGRLETAAIHGVPLQGDDSAWTESTVRLKPDTTGKEDTDASTAASVVSGFSRTTSVVSGFSRTSDGGRIVWVRDDHPLTPKRLTMFTFRVEDALGQPAGDLELYMGMPGHAIFVRRDRRVFAHVHPSGSAPMAAMDIAMPSMPSHAQHGAGLPATVSFPYGFPEPGDYRIFVQVKRAGRVVTAAFDAHVE
jgi:hypothetical protein